MHGCEVRLPRHLLRAHEVDAGPHHVQLLESALESVRASASGVQQELSRVVAENKKLGEENRELRNRVALLSERETLVSSVQSRCPTPIIDVS